MKIYDLLVDASLSNKKVLEKLIAYYLEIPRETIFAHYDMEISQDFVNKIRSSHDEFVKNLKPLEYIMWYVEFLWNKFLVNENTLIPRPETEYMINSINEFLAWISGRKFSVIDVGTWCGVLWLSTFYFNQDKISNLYLSDITDEALKVAKSNYKNLFQSKKVVEPVYIKSNLVQFLLDKQAENLEPDVVLIGNLPYIPDDVFEENVEENVKKWEPRVAFLWWKEWIDLYRIMFDQLIEYNKTANKKITMFLEMMTFQTEILQQEYPQFEFEVVATFHFNIKILKVKF